MSTREQFGNYLLLKKLTEDPLGETFRAGMLGAKGMERVALLRVFNGQGLDGHRLWAATQPRAAIQQALRGPNLGEGIEVGEIQGIPYIAYDYVSGKNLATLLDQAAKKRSPIPTEHALLIAERIALGLALAAENRLGGERIHHGFLVPHLVMISNEGESRVLGFEVAQGLRTFAANPVIRQHFGRYLSPEALRGESPDRADDVYSLGVVLFELLTGKPLPAGDDFGTVLDQATLSDEGVAIPDGLKQLLRQSLCARDQRQQDIAAWHKSLNKWMFEGKYNPTTFNLAFFMHNLFRQDIERESQEIEVEKTLPLPVVAPAPAPDKGALATAAGAATVPIATMPAPPRDTPATETKPPAPEPAKRSKAGVWIGLAALLAAIAGAAAWYFTRGDAPTSTPPAIAQTAAPTPGLVEDSAGLADPSAADGSLAVEEADEAAIDAEVQDRLQTQIDNLVEQKASDMESQLREQMDSQLEQLRKQLEDAQTEADAREKELAEAREKAAEDERLKAQAEADRLAEEERVRQEAAAAKVAEEERLRLEAEAAKQAEADAAAAKKAATPTVRRGDLVEPGPNVTPPKLLRIPPARFPEMARRLNKNNVEVVVRVLVDENGDVVDAKLPAEKVGFGFDSEALKVARKATYEPAKAGRTPVKMWAAVRVKFQT